MVTANFNQERRPSSAIGSEDDEEHLRPLQSRLVSFSSFLSAHELDKTTNESTLINKNE